MTWNIVPLGDVADFVNGFTFNSADWQEQGLPIIRIQNLTGTNSTYNRTTRKVHNKYLVSSGDLLVSWSASLGIYEWSGKDALLNQHIFKVTRDKSRITHRYLFHALTRCLQSMQDQMHGATMKHITKNKFLAIEIPLPPLSDQKRIAAILDKADAIRRKRKAALDMADEFLRATFLDMFGDPVTNPKGWDVGCIGNLLKEAKYGTAQKADPDRGEFPILRMGNITYSGWIDTADLKYVDLSEKDKPKYLARPGDILFNRTNSKELVGKTAVFNEDRPMAIAGYLVRARVNDKGNPYYISAYMNSQHGKKTLEGMCKSIVGMANINAKEFQKISIMLPPKSLQDKYEKVVQALIQKKKRLSETRREADNLFASLSQRAFRGEL